MSTTTSAVFRASSVSYALSRPSRLCFALFTNQGSMFNVCKGLALLDSSGCEIEGFYHARVRNLRAIVQLANILLGRRLEEAHAPRLFGHERAADVAYRPALRGHVLARLDGRFLGARELVHRNALQIALHHEHRHVGPPSGTVELSWSLPLLRFEFQTA